MSVTFPVLRGNNISNVTDTVDSSNSQELEKETSGNVSTIEASEHGMSRNNPSEMEESENETSEIEVLAISECEELNHMNPMKSKRVSIKTIKRFSPRLGAFKREFRASSITA